MLRRAGIGLQVRAMGDEVSGVRALSATAVMRGHSSGHEEQSVRSMAANQRSFTTESVNENFGFLGKRLLPARMRVFDNRNGFDHGDPYSFVALLESR